MLVELGGEGEPLVLASHVDTLGAMVRSIKDNGRLRPTTLGGHQWSTADGENCTVYTRDGNVYTGVVLNTEPSAARGRRAGQDHREEHGNPAR